MTCEIALLNKNGAALAADSAATVSNGRIFNNSIKLFPLSEYFPVGIFIYDNAEFMRIPWETVIDHFKNFIIKNTSYNYLEDYKNAFIDYLKNIDNHIKIDFNLYTALKISIKKSLDRSFKNENNINNIKEFKKNEGKIKTVTSDEYFNKINLSELIPEEYKEKSEFDKLKEEDKDKKDIYHLLKNDIRSFFENFESGLVIVGYGEKEFFPSLYEIKVVGKIENFFISEEINNVKVSNENEAYILPFAQKDFIDVLLNGFRTRVTKKINDIYKRQNSGTIRLTEKILNNEGFSSDKVKKILTMQSNNYEETYNFINEFSNRVLNIKKIAYKNFISMLEKEHMCEFSENLIKLTYLQIKHSGKPKVVGGPIDVAFISKTDGFTWIKQKKKEKV